MSGIVEIEANLVEIATYFRHVRHMDDIAEKKLTRRQTDIVETLRAEGTVRIGELARRMAVSLETIRRDIRPLVDIGALVKHHGSVGHADFRG